MAGTYGFVKVLWFPSLWWRSVCMCLFQHYLLLIWHSYKPITFLIIYPNLLWNYVKKSPIIISVLSSLLKIKDHSLSLLYSAMPCPVNTDIEPIPVHTMAQVICCWPITMEAWVHSRTSPCRIYTGQRGNGIGFLWVFRVSPVSIIPPMLLTHSFMCHGYCIISVIDSIVK